MPTEYRDVDVDAQMRAFVVALEAHTAEPIRPGPPPVDDDRETLVVEPMHILPQPDRRRWLLPAVAAAVVVVVVVAGLVVLSDDTTPSDTPTSTTTPPPTTTTPEDEAQQPSPVDVAVVDAFFGAYNDGDTDSVLALAADDLVVTEQYGGRAPESEQRPVPQP